MRHFQPLPSPQALHTLVIDLTAGIPKRDSNAAVSVATILPGQLDHVGDKAFFVFLAPRHMALCGTMLTKHTDQARRSETPSLSRTWSMHRLRREGLEMSSPGSLSQYLLVQSEVGNGPPELFILLSGPL